MAVAFTFGAAAVGGAAWFLLAWLVVHEAIGDAAGEALGVAFGVLIVTSVIGALRGFARRGSSTESDASTEHPEKRS